MSYRNIAIGDALPYDRSCVSAIEIIGRETSGAPAPVISIEIMFCKLTKQDIPTSTFLVQYASPSHTC
jgi:hypothetical protein